MRRAAEAIRDLFFYKTLQPSRERLQPFVMLKIAMGGTVRPSAAWRARTRAALRCQSTLREKNAAWLGRRRLTRTNSEKKTRRPWFSFMASKLSECFSDKARSLLNRTCIWQRAVTLRTVVGARGDESYPTRSPQRKQPLSSM